MQFADYDLSDVEEQLSDRTRVVAFPWASNALGTLVDAGRICGSRTGAGALAWVDAVHYAPHGPIGVAGSAPTFSLCSPYKFYGRTSGSPSSGGSCSTAGGRTRCVPRPGYETGTAQHELLAGFVAAVEYVESIGWDAITAHERARRALPRRAPEGLTLYGQQTMVGRVSTFSLNVDGRYRRRSPPSSASAASSSGTGTTTRPR